MLLTESYPLWTIDSRATNNVVNDRSAIVEFRRIPQGTKWIYVGVNSKVEVKGIGTCKLVMQSGQTLSLHDVLFAPDIIKNLVSMLVLIKLDFELLFHGQGVDLFIRQQFCGSAYFYDCFIVLDVEHGESNECFSYITSVVDYENNVEVWHARLGHIDQSRMDQLTKEGLLENVNKVELSIYEHCLARKTIRKPFGKGTRAEFPLQLIHSGICGQMNVKARHEIVYSITFIDDFTQCGYVYLIFHKSQALDCFIKSMNLVENQLDKEIKTLRTDQA